MKIVVFLVVIGLAIFWLSPVLFPPNLNKPFTANFRHDDSFSRVNGVEVKLNGVSASVLSDTFKKLGIGGVFDGYIRLRFKADGAFKKDYCIPMMTGGLPDDKVLFSMGSGTYARNDKTITCTDGCVYLVQQNGDLSLVRLERGAGQAPPLGMQMVQMPNGNRLVKHLPPPDVLPHTFDQPMYFYCK
jgi:hypothetical protein